MATPSRTYNGWAPPRIALWPRIWTEMPPSVDWLTVTPETLPCRTFSIGSFGAGWMSSEVTVLPCGAGAEAADFPPLCAQPTTNSASSSRLSTRCWKSDDMRFLLNSAKIWPHEAGITDDDHCWGASATRGATG